MSQRYVLVLIVLSSRLILGNPGDPPSMYLPPFDVLPSNIYPRAASYQQARNQPQHQLLHGNARLQERPQPSIQEKPNLENFSYNEIVEALNDIQKKDDTEQFRAAGRDPTSYVQFPRPYSYTSSSYGSSPTYHTPSTTEQPTTVLPAKIPIFKPDLSSLLQPVTAKVSNKMNGLVALIFSLLTGSAPEGLEMTGIKDLVVDGILRPLLVAKGGIKSLISKLSIPVVSLLLINLEVLVTVWWLWEECPTKEIATNISHPKPAYDNNSYT